MMYNAKLTQYMGKMLDEAKTNSAWQKGVREYAYELLDNLDQAIAGGWQNEEDMESPAILKKALLDGAEDWNQYSWGGCSLIYNYDIAKRLCTASELKKRKNGALPPNKSEEWLDTQARALKQAAYILRLHTITYFMEQNK